MPFYVLNRNYTLGTAYGHRIAFEKGVPVNVPAIREVELEVVRIGGERVDGDTPSPVEVVAERDEPSYEQMEAKIREAIAKIVAENDAKKFTAAGVPTAKAVSRIAGFDAERGMVEEIWVRIRQEAASAGA